MTESTRFELTTEAFYDPITQSLRAVQERFDVYQREKFTARPPEFFCLELCGEAGELANLEKKPWKGKDISRNRLEDEAADVLIALMNYCNARGIDLGEVVVEKLIRIEEKRCALEAQGEHY
jgi:NTP pyrophosphatase (non-canonical NTP hydrolase)